MKDNFGDIEGFDRQIGETLKVHTSLKSIEGKLFIDVRKWYKFPNLPDYISTKKGIMLSIQDWSVLLPLISEMVDKVYNNEGQDTV